MVERAHEAGKAARQYRDASPVEKLDIDIGDAQRTLAIIRIAGGAIDRGLAERVVGDAGRAGEAHGSDRLA
jgi:hypothetical protein